MNIGNSESILTKETDQESVQKEQIKRLVNDLEITLNELRSTNLAIQKLESIESERSEKLLPSLNERRNSLGKKVRNLKFQREFLEASDVENILLGQSEVTLTKVGRKNNTASIIEEGAVYHGVIANQSGNIGIGDTLMLKYLDGGEQKPLSTSMVRGIKQISEKEVIIETETSWYKLVITNKDFDSKDFEKGRMLKQRVDSLAPEDVIYTKNGVKMLVKSSSEGSFNLEVLRGSEGSQGEFFKMDKSSILNSIDRGIIIKIESNLEEAETENTAQNKEVLMLLVDKLTVGSELLSNHSTRIEVKKIENNWMEVMMYKNNGQDNGFPKTVSVEATKKAVDNGEIVKIDI